MVIEKHLITGTILAATTGGLLTMDFINPLNIILQFGAFGVLCFLMLHVFRHTIPRIVMDFSNITKESRTAYIDQLNLIQKMFNETLNAQRKDFRDDMRLERQSTEHKIEELTKAVHELNNLVRKVVVE